MATKQTKVTPAKTAPRRIQAPAETALSTASSAPSKDAIAAHAYELWVADGYQHGKHEDHWLRAEAELRAQLPSTPRS
jgi:hypothetical protein